MLLKNVGKKNLKRNNNNKMMKIKKGKNSKFKKVISYKS